MVLGLAVGGAWAGPSQPIRGLPIVRAEFSAALPGDKEPLSLQARFQVESLGQAPWSWARLHPLPARLVNEAGQPLWTSQNLAIRLPRGYHAEQGWANPTRISELAAPAKGEEPRSELFRQIESQLGALGLRDGLIELRGGLMSLPAAAPGQLDRLFDGALLRAMPEGRWMGLAQAKAETFLAGLGPPGAAQAVAEAMERLPRLGRVISDPRVSFEIKKQLLNSRTLATLLGAKPASLLYTEEDFVGPLAPLFEASLLEQARRVSEDLEVASPPHRDGSIAMFGRRASLLALRWAHGRQAGLDFGDLLQQDSVRFLDRIVAALVTPLDRSKEAMEGVLFGFPLSDVSWYASHAGGSGIPRAGMHVGGGLGPGNIDWTSENPAKADVVQKVILYEIVFAAARAYLGHIMRGLPLIQ